MLFKGDSRRNDQFDTSIGLGIGRDGLAILEKHPNARYIYVDPVLGLDTNDGLSPATAKGTLVGGMSLVRPGYGDWLLCASGRIFDTTQSFYGLQYNGFGLSGLSPQYPTVLSTYDVGDPLNVSRYGALRTKFTCLTLINAFYVDNRHVKNVAVRSFDIDPTDVYGGGYAFRFFNDGQYFLFENCRLRHCEILFQGVSGSAKPVRNMIVRQCSIAYHNHPTAHACGIYTSNVIDVTLEDNIWYHNGWYEFQERAGDPANNIAPADIFKHNIYLDCPETSGFIVRRNISAHASSHGIQIRPGGRLEENVFVRNPLNIQFGSGTDYWIYCPNGVPGTHFGNVSVGTTNITPSLPRGFGMLVNNTNPQLDIHCNTVFDVGPDSTINVLPNNIESSHNLPTRVRFRDNITKNWGRAALSVTGDSSQLAEYVEDANYRNVAANGSNVDADEFFSGITTRSVGDYYASIGGTNDEVAFFQAAIDQPENPLFRAPALRAYLLRPFGR